MIGDTMSNFISFFLILFFLLRLQYGELKCPMGIVPLAGAV